MEDVFAAVRKLFALDSYTRWLKEVGADWAGPCGPALAPQAVGFAPCYGVFPVRFRLSSRSLFKKSSWAPIGGQRTTGVGPPHLGAPRPI